MVRSLAPIDPEFDFDIDERYIEEVRDDVYNQAAVGSDLRGMAKDQKEIVVQCERRRISQPKRVIDELIDSRLRPSL